jgi:hypothetical protein
VSAYAKCGADRGLHLTLMLTEFGGRLRVGLGVAFSLWAVCAFRHGHGVTLCSLEGLCTRMVLGHGGSHGFS